MENLFGGLIPAKSSKLAGSGNKATDMGNMGNPLAIVKARMQLPTEISAQRVVQLEREMGEVDAQMELAKMIVARQEQLLNKGVDLYDMNAQWASVTMKAEERLKQIQGKHQQGIAQHLLGTARTQAYTDGYTEAYQMSAEIFG